MILRSSPPSPFGRKIKIALHVLGLFDKVTVQMTPYDLTKGRITFRSRDGKPNPNAAEKPQEAG